MLMELHRLLVSVSHRVKLLNLLCQSHGEEQKMLRSRSNLQASWIQIAGTTGKSTPILLTLMFHLFQVETCGMNLLQRLLHYL